MTSQFEMLKNKGFNVAKGIRYCADNPALYRDILVTAWEEGPERKTQIGHFAAAGNVKGYYAAVHTLKNVAETFGADPLAGMAAGHCEAIKKNAVLPSPDEVTALLRLYDEILQDIKSCVL